jgi:hypothetical protein
MGALTSPHTSTASSSGLAELRPRPWRLWSVELLVLACTLAVSLCLAVFTAVEHDRTGLDQRTLLSAMLAAGGMPMIYSPPALCTGRPISLSILHDRK